MLAAELNLLSEPIEGVKSRAEQLRTFLPGVNIDRLVEVLPAVTVHYACSK